MKITSDHSRRLKTDDLAGLFLVLALHAAALYGLWRYQLLPSPQETATLFVNFISPTAPPKKEETKPPPAKPQPVEKPRSTQLVAQAPVIAPTEYVAPPQPPRPTAEPVVQAPAMPLPAAPVTLTAELSVTCSERPAPNYPAPSRRMGETGTVVVNVELSETGHVTAARVSKSSNHPRLDEAALAAVRTWRCTPAMRNGQPVRAFALQPFNFVLEGN